MARLNLICKGLCQGIPGIIHFLQYFLGFEHLLLWSKTNMAPWYSTLQAHFDHLQYPFLPFVYCFTLRIFAVLSSHFFVPFFPSLGVSTQQSFPGQNKYLWIASQVLIKSLIHFWWTFDSKKTPAALCGEESWLNVTVLHILSCCFCHFIAFNKCLRFLVPR